MKKVLHVLRIAIAIFILLLLIIASDTAVTGALDGIEICMRVIVPTLFPFFVITSYLNQALIGISVPAMRPLCRKLQVPVGCDSLLLFGLIGGYPVGAQLISNAYEGKQINRNTAHILMGYCSNAGPAFIFGIAGTLFTDIRIPALLWCIHICSALITAYLLPKSTQESVQGAAISNSTLTSALTKSIQVTASVCAWIILFKIAITFIFQIIPIPFMPYLSGILELSNGCICLQKLPSCSVRFLLCACFLSFGGLCVMMQTASITKEMGMGLYIPGKVIQTIVSFILSILVLPLIFPQNRLSLQILLIPVSVSFLLIYVFRKYAEKRYGNPVKNTV